jgi:hypothetical protein
MTQTQLLALDTILPTILGVIGLIFLVAAFWPLSHAIRTYALRSTLFAVVGIGCVAVGVWMWLNLLRTAGQIIVQQVPPPGGSVTTTISGARPPASASIAASGAALPSAVASAQAAPTAAPSAASPAAPTAAPTTPPAPTPTLALTPVPALTFQPENTNQHALIVGVEAFEHGSMLYRDDLKQIYVMTPDKQFKVYPDTWSDTKPDVGNLTPDANSKIRPGRGFGWLWASDPDVRQTLGLGLTGEMGFTGTVAGNGTSTTIRADVTYVFNKDGTWTLQ